MNTTAVRLYGKNDLRLERFALLPISDEELLVRVVTDSSCLSTYKAVSLGTGHKRIPKDIAQNPIVIGHEMCVEILEVGARLTHAWEKGDKAVIQPALNMPDNDYSIGYSFCNFGGNMTCGVIPKEVIERGCVIKTTEETFFKSSLVEPLSCLIRGFKSMYHTDQLTFERSNGTKPKGKIAILGGAGPMGLGAIDLALHYADPAMVVVTDVNAERLARAARAFTPEAAAASGIDLLYVDTSKFEDPAQHLLALSSGGFDDIFVMVPIPAVLEMADQLLAVDGCANFFAGPTDQQLKAKINFYRVHYDFTHHIGTSGGNPEDTVEVVRLIEKGVLNPAAMLTHIGGLDSVIETVMGLGKPSDGLKKMCYNALSMPMTAIDSFEALGQTSALFGALDAIVKRNGGLWCAQAEAYLLANAPKIEQE